jgi:DNA-binding NarL/FixJ family response regulator
VEWLRDGSAAATYSLRRIAFRETSRTLQLTPATGATMKRTPQALRILYVEDSENDVELALRQLRRGGYAPQATRVESADAMHHALSSGGWDVVLSDCFMPKFGAKDALALLRARALDIPFLVVSGTISEPSASAIIQAGARAVLQKDELAQLGSLVRRVLEGPHAPPEAAPTPSPTSPVVRSVAPGGSDESLPKFLVVEDSHAYARSLKRIISRRGSAHIVHNARDAHAAIHAAAWAGIFLDVGLPDGSGLDVLARVRTFRPTTPVLVLTGDNEPEAINRACELGASFAIKPASTSLIETFIRSAQSLRQRLARAAVTWRERHALSEAESDVLLRSALGESRPEIASARSSSILTVKKHCERIVKKTGARSYQEAVAGLVREVAG